MKPTHLIASASLIACASLWGSGCAQQCKQMSADYERTLAREAALEQTAQEAPALPTMATHVGLGVRLDLISALALTLLGEQVGPLLKLVTKIPLGAGQVVDVNLNGAPINLRFEQDSACPQCFRLAGELGGSLTVVLPVLGKQTLPLGGSLRLIAPIVFETVGQDTIRVKLDTQKFVDYAQSAILNLDIKQLPDSWVDALKQPLTTRLIAQLSQQLKPINLLTFQSPDFGVKGLRLMPSSMAFEPTKKALFLGFTTNLPGIAADEGLDIQSAVSFQGDENVAMAIQPHIIPTLVTLLMKDGQIPRRYTTDGKADEAGPAHITLSAFSFAGQRSAATAAPTATGSPRSSHLYAQGSSGPQSRLDQAQPSPMSLGFRAWNLLGAACFWFDAVVSGDVTLQDRVLTVELQDIKLTDASIAPSLIKGLVNWRTAQFLQETKTLMTRTLGQPKIELHGATLQLAASSLVKDPRTLVLKSNVLWGKRP